MACRRLLHSRMRPRFPAEWHPDGDGAQHRHGGQLGHHPDPAQHGLHRQSSAARERQRLELRYHQLWRDLHQHRRGACGRVQMTAGIWTYYGVPGAPGGVMQQIYP